jgi:hypothetical protein
MFRLIDAVASALAPFAFVAGAGILFLAVLV